MSRENINKAGGASCAPGFYKASDWTLMTPAEAAPTVALPFAPHRGEAVSNLGKLLGDLKLATQFTSDEVAGVLMLTAVLQTALAAGLASNFRPLGASVQDAGEDRLLTATQVALRFGRSVAWVYRRAKKREWEPFTKRETSKTLRFSEAGLRKYLAAQEAGRGRRVA